MKFGSLIVPMVIEMNEQKLSTVVHLRVFLEGTEEVRFEPFRPGGKRYAFVAEVVWWLR